MSAHNQDAIVRTVLITGANAGLGKESARQMALLDSTEKVYLGCRNEEKAKAAKRALEEATGKSIFEIVLMDVSNLDSVKAAVASLPEPIDGLVMNAGGMGGKTPAQQTADGVTHLFASNVLGHVVLLEELLKANKLNKVAIYAGSEGARGIAKMGLKRPVLQTSSVDEFVSIADGSFFGDNMQVMDAYSTVKYMAALWMTSMARAYPDVRIVTVSPGSTSGTAAARDLPFLMRMMFSVIGPRLLPLVGLMHGVDVGAKRYVDVLTDPSYKSGVFYASKEPTATGPLIDQATIWSNFNNVQYQDNVHEAIHRFLN